MGLSGSAQSTVLRAVNGLNKGGAGQAPVKDDDRMVDVASCDPNTLRHIRQKQVAMVFQQFALLPWRTVRENVGFGLELAGVPEPELKERVDQQLKLVGLAPGRTSTCTSSRAACSSASGSPAPSPPMHRFLDG